MIFVNLGEKNKVTKKAGKIFQFLKKIFLSLGKEKVYVFGDSHTEVFEHLNTQKDTKVFFDVTWVGGATALGLRNPNSKTNALKIFKEKIMSIHIKNRSMVFLLGEVDTGFVMWYRASKYNESTEKQLEETVKTYFEFLDWTKNKGFNNITVVSAPLPTIKDNQEWGEVANLRKEIRVPQIDRTNLTLEYNKRLKEECQKRRYCFIDCDIDLLDKNTKIIQSVFINSDPNNHHLDLDAYADLIKSKLVFK